MVVYSTDDNDKIWFLSMCILEFTHVLPMLVILAAYAVSGKSFRVAHLTVVLAAVVGLMSGSHVHAEHAAFTLFDSCTLYVATLLFSGYQLLKSVKLFARSNG